MCSVESPVDEPGKTTDRRRQKPNGARKPVDQSRRGGRRDNEGRGRGGRRGRGRGRGRGGNTVSSNGDRLQTQPQEEKEEEEKQEETGNDWPAAPEGEETTT